VTPPTPAEPESLGDDDSIAALLDAAEDIVNNAGLSIRAEVDAERNSSKRSRRWGVGRLFGREKRKE